MKERIENLIKKSQELGAIVSTWECGFLDSVHRQLDDKRKDLSAKQIDIIHRIEAKIEKTIKGDPDWEAAWDKDKAWAFKVAVDYYNAGSVRYFGNILDWVAENSDKIPPRNFYKKLVENKYAQKVINSLKAKPKYAAGSAVMFRADARRAIPYLTWQNLKGILLFVVEPTNRAVTAARGTRIYSLLSSNSMETIEVEERFIKKWKQPKNNDAAYESNVDDTIPF